MSKLYADYTPSLSIPKLTISNSSNTIHYIDIKTLANYCLLCKHGALALALSAIKKKLIKLGYFASISVKK